MTDWSLTDTMKAAGAGGQVSSWRWHLCIQVLCVEWQSLEVPLSCLGGQRLSPRAYLGCQSLRVRLDSRDIQLTESGGLFAYFVGQTQGPGCMWRIGVKPIQPISKKKSWPASHGAVFAWWTCYNSIYPYSQVKFFQMKKSKSKYENYVLASLKVAQLHEATWSVFY